MTNVFDNLNAQQAKAVGQINGAMLILAGAGSGKTTVLTRRTIHMIESGIDPKNILAITFSNKAAEEMRVRITNSVPDNRGAEVKVKTFHALCAEILRKEKTAFGSKIFHNKNAGRFVICSSDDCRMILQDAINESGFAAFEISAADMLKRIDKLKNEGINVEEFRKQSLEKKQFVDEVFSKIFRQYQAILSRNNCLDFNDLLLYVLELFEKCPDILKKYQEQYRYIMVDEYQDTNHVQYMLVQKLASAHRNLCVVGDDDQSIYGFRGADINNILNFEKDYPEATVIKLEQNYRSSRKIVESANAIIRNNKKRMEKCMHSEQGDGTGILYARFKTAEEEALQIARSIYASHKQGIPYNEIAVLYRINSISQPIERELTKLGIPYKLSHGIGLLDHKETKDILAYLKLLDNLHDDISLKRIINVPARKIGDRTLESLTSFARKECISLWSALKRCEEIWLKDDIPESIPCFISMIEHLQKISENLPISVLIEEILKSTGYMDFVLKNIPRGYTTQYIHDLQDFANMYDESLDKEKSLNDFLERVAFMTDADRNDSIDAVSLLSGHRCKGLEFSCVYLVAMEEGILPHKSAIYGCERFLAMEEERRLFYVMVTRAKNYLFISSAEQRKLKGVTEEREVSRFATELIPK